MKKQFVYVELKVKDQEEYVLIKDSGIEVEPTVLTRYLREGIRNGEITGGLGVTEDRYTKYTFNAKNIDPNEPDHYFVVKISNQIIKSGSPTANIIKSLSKRSVKQTKKNITRLMAVAAASFVLVTSSVYFIAKELKKFNTTVDNYQKNYSMSQQYIENHKLPEEANEEYYADLERRAKEGDKEAIEEYSNYLIEQELKQQRENEERSRGIIRK